MAGDHLKRPPPPHDSPKAKRHHSPENTLHIRILIEPGYCARVLGPKGNRLRELRKAADESRLLDSWISSDNGFEYRVMHILGTPASVARFLGLLVRAIHDEGAEPSGESSRPYDLKMLIPHPLMGKLIGTKMAIFKDIEQKSSAFLSADREKLPQCDDRIVHVYGVADSIHIACFHICEIYDENLKSLANTRLREYEPGPQALNFKKHHPSAPQTQNASPATPVIAPALPVPDSPLQVQTAFETAKNSKRDSLSQIIKLPQNRPKRDLDELIENIKRVTNSELQILDDESEYTIQLDGHPEENTLALFLVWRYLKNKHS